MEGGQRVGSVMQDARDRLRSVSDTPGMDVQLLLAHVSGLTREELLAHPEHLLPEDEAALLEDLVARCMGGTALPYLLGWWEFYGRRFHITPDVLIPRPETELLVERALAETPEDKAALVLDVGTGSGIIAATLLLERPRWQAAAVDRYLPALQAAAVNRRQHSLETRMALVQGDLADGFSGGFDLVCANLPYIPSAKLPTLAVAAREPKHALDGGEDGLVLIRRLLLDVPRLLCRGGMALLEIEAGQGADALSFVRDKLQNTEASVVRDLAGRDRLLEVRIA